MQTEERFLRLERQNRRMKQGLILIALFVGAVFSLGATMKTGLGETVKAQAFVVEDKRGIHTSGVGPIEG